MVNVRLCKKVQSYLFCEAKEVFALQKSSAMERAEKFDKNFARCLFFFFFVSTISIYHSLDCSEVIDMLEKDITRI